MIKEVRWGWDLGVYIPFCPYCGELAYDKDWCCFCDKPYKWVESDVKSTEVTLGEYTAVQSTNNHVSICKNGMRVFHLSCREKLTEDELLQQIALYKQATNDCLEEML